MKRKHPKGLMTLFFTEMWERFSYYGMRALLVLYLTDQMITGGFGLERSQALEVYAIFTGLVYLTPILGGLLADKLLGQRKAIYIGGIVMALGQFSMALSEFGDMPARNEWLSIGLGLLIIGNGFFKPNISTIVGSLYTQNDPRKDSAFTIFYMGINLGAFLAPLVCGALGEGIDWFYGFTAAGIGMIIGLFWFYFRRETLGYHGLPPARLKTLGHLADTELSYSDHPTGKVIDRMAAVDPKEVLETEDSTVHKSYRLNTRDNAGIIGYVLVSIGLVVGFLKLWSTLGPDLRSNVTLALGIITVLGIAYVIMKGTKGAAEWKRVGAILIFVFFNVFFWAGFEQAGGTFNLFAAENTDRMFAGWEIPASVFQSINAIFIFALAPVFSVLWMYLSDIRKNPNTPVKFGLGLLLLGAGFVVMSAANNQAADGDLVSPFWLVGVYFLHTLGELCLSPIGLSMITKLSPPKIVSMMMGLWFASTALANYMAGILEALLENYMPDMPLFTFLTATSLSAGVLMLLISPLVKKLMGNTR